MWAACNVLLAQKKMSFVIDRENLQTIFFIIILLC